MKSRKFHRTASSALTAGLVLTASSLSLAAASVAERASDGSFQIAQKGPQSGQQSDDDQDRKKRRHKGDRDGGRDGVPNNAQRDPRGHGPQNDGFKSRAGGSPPPGVPPAGDRTPKFKKDFQRQPAQATEPAERGAPFAGEPGRDRDRNGKGERRFRKDSQPPTSPPSQATQPSGRTAPFAGEPGRDRDGQGERRFRKDGQPPTNPPSQATQPGGRTAPFAGEPGRDRNGQGERRFRRDAESPNAPAPANRPGAVGRRFDDDKGRGERGQWRREQREAERRGGFTNVDALKRNRKERHVKGGGTIIEEPDARRIISNGNRSFIIRDENRRLQRFGRVSDSRRRPGGGNITTIVRPDGGRIITETSPDGRLIRRYRRTRDGRTIILVDNRRTWRKWGAIGAGAVLATGLLLALDPPHYRGPRERYIIEYDGAGDDDIYDALMAPPIDDIGRGYTLDHVLFNYNLRERMRRIDLDSIHFEFGAWDIDESQYGKLERLARAMGRILDRNADEVFLIEGHTDAVGDPVSNRSLSDRRAEEVANILTEEFDIPPENLVIQGYGEEFLKVDTEEASRINRRVTVRRITPLLDRREAGYRD